MTLSILFAILAIFVSLVAAFFALIAALQIPSWLLLPGMVKPRQETVEIIYKAMLQGWQNHTAEDQAAAKARAENVRKEGLERIDKEFGDSWWQDRTLMVRRSLVAFFCLAASGILQALALIFQ